MSEGSGNPAFDEDWLSTFSNFFDKSLLTPVRISSEFDWIEDLVDKNQRDGFFFAADSLVRDLLEKEELERREPDRKFHGVEFAMLYCYRHYLEVTLKHLIKIYGPYANSVSTIAASDLAKEHGLMKLWNQAKKLMIATTGEEYDQKARKVAEAIINAFHQVDSSSQIFRYSHSTEGKRTRHDIPTANLQKLRKMMAQLKNYFDVQDDVVDSIQSGA